MASTLQQGIPECGSPLSQSWTTPTAKTMEATVLKSEPPGAEQTEMPSFTLKSRATYTV